MPENENEETTEIVVPAMDAKTFEEASRPKGLEEEPDKTKRLLFFKCTCGKAHFRHAGYLQTMMPLMRPGQGAKINTESLAVNVCVACRKSYVFSWEQMYDVTDQIDVKAWEKAEKELQAATGPGGEC